MLRIHSQRQLQAIRLIGFSSVVGRHGGTCLAGGPDASHPELCCHLLEDDGTGQLLDGDFAWQLQCMAFVFIGLRSKTMASFEMVI